MGNAGDDPLPLLLNVSNSGGFRYRGQVDALELVVLTSSRKDPDWPDTLDRETGVYTYFGDNKSPGRGLHETPRKGNELLQRIFDLAHSGIEGRQRVPPIFLFANIGEWRDVVFLGLAVPGTADLRTSEDLVAIWKISKSSRFQNYRARFSVLDAPSLSRAWIADIIAGNPGAGARGGGHGGLRPAWCDAEQPLLMRCQGFFQGQNGGMKALTRGGHSRRRRLPLDQRLERRAGLDSLLVQTPDFDAQGGRLTPTQARGGCKQHGRSRAGPG